MHKNKAEKLKWMLERVKGFEFDHPLYGKKFIAKENQKIAIRNNLQESPIYVDEEIFFQTLNYQIEEKKFSDINDLVLQIKEIFSTLKT